MTAQYEYSKHHMLHVEQGQFNPEECPWCCITELRLRVETLNKIKQAAIAWAKKPTFESEEKLLKLLGIDE